MNQNEYDENDYKHLFAVVNGLIVTPGKFEQRPVWLPHFWNRVMVENSVADDEGRVTLQIEHEDVRRFPTILTHVADTTASAVTLWEDKSGLVHYYITSGYDECTGCHERFTALRTDKYPLCARCRGPRPVARKA